MKYLYTHYHQEVCLLELNRPEKRNALNKTVIKQLITFLEENADNKDFKVLVLSGRGLLFCAGADLEWMGEGSKQSLAQNQADAELFNTLYRTLNNFPKPVVVQVNGGAYGGALGLLACADVVTTSREASFVFSETALGLIPATVAPWIVLKIGMAQARRVMLTGLPFNGLEAKDMGLAHYLFSKEELSAKTLGMAEQIAQNGPIASQQTKKLLNRIGNSIVPMDEDLINYCASAIAQARASEEGREGVNAFFEKRLPSWTIKNE
jgi:methylglutaconyl-CoA hydratase